MNNIGLMFKGICTLKFRYDDSSELYIVSSLNDGILKRYGMSNVDALVDLTAMKRIPSDMLTRLVEIEEGVVEAPSQLDRMFSEGAKIAWKR